MINKNPHENLDEEIRVLLDDDAPPRALTGALYKLAWGGYYEYESRYRELLGDQNPDIRAQALSRLVGTWGRVDLLDETIRMALHDPSLHVRSEAYGALNELVLDHGHVGTPIEHAALVALVAALTKETDEVLHAIAYRAIWRIRHVQGLYKGSRACPMNRERDMDRELFEPYLKEAEGVAITPLAPEEMKW